MLHLDLLLTLAATPPRTYQQPYKMTYTSADPVGARDFTIKYLGAVERHQPHSGGDGTCALIKWVGFPGTNAGGELYQMHFVKGYHRPNGTMTIDEFENQMAALHGKMQNYDRFMDFHVTMSAGAHLDTFAAPMLRDGIPMLTRYDSDSGLYSIFFEVPHAIVIELTGTKLSVLKASEWDRCGTPKRATVDTDAVKQVLEARSPSLRGQQQQQQQPTTLPPLVPVRAVYASSEPEETAAFVATYFEGERVSDPAVLPGSGNGTCFDAQLVRWTNPDQDTPYELLWIKSSAPQGSGITLPQFEDYLRHLHTADISPGIYDEYMDFHVGLTFNDGDPLARRLLKDKVPYFLRGQYGSYCDFFIQGPGGQIYEVLAHEQTVFTDLPSWDLCGPLNVTNPELAKS